MLYYERKRLKMTGKEMALRLGVSFGYYYHVETGHRPPTVKLVTQLCKFATSHHNERKWHREAARAQGWKV